MTIIIDIVVSVKFMVGGWSLLKFLAVLSAVMRRRSGWESNEPPRQTTKASPANTEPKGSQLDEWYKTQETHEQLVVGEKTSRTFAKTLGFLEEIEEKVDGDDRGEENTRG
ncbi:hypothetical protein HO173_009605 [Letharia columbiana]|uniref:Uncharacterized protein n=1 Tax=Letharia columbiana TaxID=112416 RepID=A0A8H6FPD1_9LECA|nr:uncharacterized protein HO173_009605 [Letharia columbiana]KAF6232222.1 hypothetical protein HO173_009605 [Letharia columbiana]